MLVIIMLLLYGEVWSSTMNLSILFSLNNDSLRQMCGVNTSYAGISCGYGIFPPKNIQKSMENSSIEDWGINEYNIKGSSIRKYLKDKWVDWHITLSINTFIYLFGLRQLSIFLELTMQKNFLHVVSNTHLCQYPFSILLPEFLDVSDITLLCWMLEKVVNIEICRPFLPL